MLYAILCYNSESLIAAWTREKDDQVMAEHHVVERKLAAQGRLGPVARLMPTTTATTLRHAQEALIIDGPFAETKEQLLGFYVVECASLDEAIETARPLSVEGGALEIRPIMYFNPGGTSK